MSNHKTHKILVVGASGTEIVRLLRTTGHSVRITTGKPAADPDSVRVNLITGEGLEAAFAGIERAFFLSPGGHADQYRILSPLVAKAKAAGLNKVVMMTAIGVEHNPEAPMRRAEIELEKSGIAYNIIRPSWFMQNFNTFWVHGIKAQRQIRLPVGEGKAGFIDARDIASVASMLLTEDTLKNRSFTLTGADSLTHAEVARHISAALGQTISFIDVDPEELKQALLGGGVPADYVEFLLMLLGFLKAGFTAAVTDSVREILGRPPISFTSYARDFASAWK
jgi:uncharacterized protein YbjT (DUF2867 family)